MMIQKLSRVSATRLGCCPLHRFRPMFLTANKISRIRVTPLSLSVQPGTQPDRASHARVACLPASFSTNSRAVRSKPNDRVQHSRLLARNAKQMRSKPLSATAQAASLLQSWEVGALLAVCAAVGQVSEKRTPLGRALSSPLVCMISAMLLSGFGVLPASCALYDVVWTALLPMAAALYLLEGDFSGLLTSGRLLGIAFLVGSVGMVLGAFTAWTLVGSWMGAEGAKLAASLCASYVGGGVNMAAISSALHVSPTVLPAAMMADNLVMAVALGAIMAWPTHDTDTKDKHNTNHGHSPGTQCTSTGNTQNISAEIGSMQQGSSLSMNSMERMNSMDSMDSMNRMSSTTSTETEYCRSASNGGSVGGGYSNGTARHSNGAADSSNGIASRNNGTVDSSNSSDANGGNGTATSSNGATNNSNGTVMSSDGATHSSNGVAKSSNGATNISNGATNISNGIAKSSNATDYDHGTAACPSATTTTTPYSNGLPSSGPISGPISVASTSISGISTVHTYVPESHKTSGAGEVSTSQHTHSRLGSNDDTKYSHNGSSPGSNDAKYSMDDAKYRIDDTKYSMYDAKYSPSGSSPSGGNASKPVEPERESGGTGATNEGEAGKPVTPESIALGVAAAAVSCAAGNAVVPWLGVSPAFTLLAVACCATITAIVVGRMAGNQVFAGSSDLGAAIMSVYFAVVGASAGQLQGLGGCMGFVAFMGIMIAVHGVFLWLIAKVLLRLPTAVVLVGANACVGGPATAAGFAAARHWPELVQPAMLMGSLGYAIGNGAGLLVASVIGA